MKRLAILILITLISCTIPTDPKSETANIYGEVGLSNWRTIKYSGRVEMQYNGTTTSSTLSNPHMVRMYNVYDYSFENVEILEGKQAIFVVKLMNGFGAETVYADTAFVLKDGDNNFRLNIK